MVKNKRNVMIGEQLHWDGDLESCVHELFNPKQNILGQEFFESTILSLSKWLNADYVFIAQLNNEADNLDTVAFCDKQHVKEATSFVFDNLPVDEVISRKEVIHKNDVQKSYPNTALFQDLNIETLSMVPLYNGMRQPIGVLATMFCNSTVSVKKIEAMLYMFSSRISSELEHTIKQRELEKRNMELLVFKEELIRKNIELDKINRELKEANLKAKESDKLKTSFLANLSHEVRTPMNAIIGFTELLKSNNLNPDERKEYINIVHQNGNQLMRVMDALIDISKLQAKVYVEYREKVSINKLLNSLSDNFSQELKVMQKPIKFNLILGNEDGKDGIYTYKEALNKIFDHLLSNAIKFTHQGNIYIGYTISDNDYEFFVKDSGIGIPSGLEERIFDLFRQAECNNSREFGGNGIGLSIVKKYVEIMGGKVWAEPDQKEGALFKFTIPISK